jgi:uncharacterized membrane protein
MTTPDPKPSIDPQQLAKLEQDLLEKVEKKVEMKKLEAQADAEMTEINNAGSSINMEQILLIITAAIMIISLPFIHFLLAIVLAAFTIILALVAGFSSPKHPLSPRANLFMSLVGLIIFECSAIITHSTVGTSGVFVLYQVLAFLFLLATFFSARTYRRKILEGA